MKNIFSANIAPMIVSLVGSNMPFSIMIFCALVLWGCGLKVGESAQPIIVVEAQSSACLEQSISDFKLMFKGQLNDERVAPAMDCLSRTVKEFTTSVQGADARYFTPEELVSFLNKKVFKNVSPIKMSLANEVMKIKTSILGGTATEFTKDQLLQFCKNVDQLTPDMILLNRFFRAQKSPQWKTDYLFFLKTESDFHQAVDHFTELIQNGYDLNDLKPLLLEWGFEDLDQYTDLLISAHQLATSIERSALNSIELKNLLFLGSRAYFHLLEYQNFLDPLTYSHEGFAPAALRLQNKAYETLDKALSMNTQGFMSSKHFIQTYEIALKALNQKPSLSDDSLKIVLTSLWSNILNMPTLRLKGDKLPGFNHSALLQLNSYLHLLFTADIQASQISAQQMFPKQDQLRKLIQDQIFLTTDAYTLQILREMQAALSGPVAFTLTQNFLKILDPQSGIYNYQDLQISNIARLASRLLVMAYSTSLSQIQNLEKFQSQMTLDELKTFFDQIKSVLVELDLLSQNTDTFIESRFREANLFMTRSNGDQNVSFLEAHDIVIHLISGTYRASQLRPYIIQQCLPFVFSPVKAAQEMDEACLLEAYYQSNLGFDFLPKYAWYKSTQNEKPNKEYYLDLLIAGGYVMDKRHRVLMEDADRFPHIVQYIEMMYALFDTNRDNEFTKDEALRAFPLYKELIKKAVASMSGGDSVKEDELPGVFIYLLKYGRAPEGWFEKIQFKLFIGNEKKWVINSQRADIGRVFKSLNQY